MREEYTTFGYRSLFTRILIVITWLALLGVFNYMLIYYFYNWHISWILFLLFVFLWIVFFFMIRLIRGMKYVIAKDWITVILPSGRTYFFSLSDIEKIEFIGSIPWRKWFWLKYNFFTKEAYFTTSNKNLFKIYTVHWRSIIISPKSFEEKFLNLYNKK